MYTTDLLVSSQSSLSNRPAHMELLQGMNSRNQRKAKICIRTVHCTDVKKG